MTNEGHSGLVNGDRKMKEKKKELDRLVYYPFP
jgi:hypothetical protein